MTQLALPFKPRRFFVTTRLSDAELAEAIARASLQDDAVLALYRAHIALSPSACWRLYEQHGKHAPLTSIRRSITVLTSAGALQKSEAQVPGLYGSPEHVWRLAA